MPQQTSTAPIVRSGYNGSGSTIAKGTAVKLVSGGAYQQIAPVAALGDAIYGIAQADIPNLGYGNVVVCGSALVKVAAAITVGAKCGTTAAGLGTSTVAAGTSVIGVALTGGSATELAEVLLAGPGAMG